MGKRNRLRRKLWNFFQSNPFWFFVSLLVTFREWVGETIRTLRNEVARAVDAIVAVPPRRLLTIAAVLALPFLLHRLRLLRRARVGQLTGISYGKSQCYGAMTDTTPAVRNTVIAPPTGSLVITGHAPLLPPGTAGGIAMAGPTGPPFVPHFVNNSHWAQYEAYQRDHYVAAQVAMQSTMPKFNPALLSAG